MYDERSKKIGVIAGVGAVVFGSAFGLAATAESKSELESTKTFPEKLSVIASAIARGAMTPFTADRDGKWTTSNPDDLKVAQWLQTWSKWDKSGTTPG